ncbi:MAG: adenosylcobinamide-GDP ribazoletransferase [Rhodobacteraceae bacterium]|nr:adenosylcobinamide-GDP ribazoletransferase [Paracoccaceae bacterium]
MLWYDFVVACTLLSRLPTPILPDAAFARQARAAWAFPLVGGGVAALAGAIGWGLLCLGLPLMAVAGIVLAVQIVATGAMHEDGLADTVDGFWGGWTPEQRLQIMRDSHIGTYGVLVLVASFALRLAALTSLMAAGWLWAPLIAAAAMSRAGLPMLMTALPHARADGLSYRVGAPGQAVSTIAIGLGIGIGVLVLGIVALIPGLLAAAVVAGLAVLALVRIRGQTGDVLGASQQVAEIVILLTLAALLT